MSPKASVRPHLPEPSCRPPAAKPDRSRTGPRPPRLLAAGLTALLAFSALLPGGLAAQTGAETDEADPVLQWPEPQRSFFQDGPGLLLSESQRRELLALTADGRARFIEAFLSRDPIPATPVNELEVGIERRKRLAAEDFSSPTDVRARLLFLNGRPEERLIVECGLAFQPLEIWTYLERVEYQADPVVHKLVVYETGPGEPWRLWLPLDSKASLYTSEMRYWLEQWEELQGRVIRAKRFDLQVCKEARKVDEATGIRGLRDFQQDRPSQADLERFLAPPADLAVWAAAAAATEVTEAPKELPIRDVEIQFPERRGQRMVTRALLTLPPDGDFGIDTEGDEPELRFSATGVVEQGGKIFDEFRVRFKLEPPAEGVPVALAVDRQLRVGRSFVLRMVVRDEVSGAETRITRGFSVPREAQAIALPPVPEEAMIALGEELSEQRIPGADSLILVPPESDVVMGLWRAEALVTGERIQKVAFLVDGEIQLTRSSPPWTAELRLNQYPTEQLVRAEGYDSNGEVVAFDEVLLNQPRGAFKVRIVEPGRGQGKPGRTTAKAEVTVPEEKRVERVEFRLDDQLVATLERPPWEAEIDIPAGAEISYLAVTAFLEDGSRAEDVRFLNTPQYLEEVDVNLVELYTAVTDRNGRLALGLSEDDFEVYEDGRLQTLSKFELMDDLPLTVGIAIDTSGSMVEAISEAKRAAVDFLDNIIERGDKTFAVAFSNRAGLLMPPTDDVAAVADVLENLQAVGWTALHDAIVTSLYYFRGIRGQRALVLLSDGDDTASTIGFREALEYARRSGVAIYAVGLDVGRLNIPVRNKLKELAQETGGRAFFISKAEELTGVYGEIEKELRSRYLLAYNSDRAEDAAEGEFREVEVKVKKRGLTARTIRGYYP